MAVTYVGSGAQTGNVAVTAVDPATSASTVPANLCVLAVAVKPYSATVTTPTDWTLIAEHTNGTTAAGTDVGSMKALMYVRTGITGAVSLGALAQSGADSMTARIITYQNATGVWGYDDFVTGGDSSNAANYSGVQSAPLPLAVGDVVVSTAAVNTDAGSPSGFGFGNVTGITVSTFDLRASAGVTTGFDCRLYVAEGVCSAGSGTLDGPMVYTNTSASSGAQIWLRLQELPAVAYPFGLLTPTPRYL